MLEVKELALFNYKPIRFILHPGNVVCVLGPNGCGKTTLLKLIMGEIDYVVGATFWKNKNINQMNPKTKSLVFGHLSAENEEIYGFTPFEIVNFGRFSSPELHSDEEILRSLEKFKCLHLKDKTYEQLSSGEKRRVLLARLDYQNSEIMILDEPASYLDFKTKKIFSDWLIEKKKENKIIIFTTHHWSDSFNECDYAIFFNSEEGNLNEILFSTIVDIKPRLA